MKFLDRLDFQSKIIAVTFLMILLVIVSGGILIERLVLPAVEDDVQVEGWRVAKVILEQAGEFGGGRKLGRFAREA